MYYYFRLAFWEVIIIIIIIPLTYPLLGFLKLQQFIKKLKNEK